jgi:hypothetical protein
MATDSDESFDYDIPPFLRMPALSHEDDARRTIKVIDKRIAWLDERGLRAHPQVLANREHCVDFLNGKAVRFESERFRRGGWF